MENITAEDFMILEKYILSNFNENYAKELGLSEKDIQDIKNDIKDYQTDFQENSDLNITFHFASVFHLACIYVLLNLSKDDRIFNYSKIAAITTLNTSPLKDSIINYINRYHANEQFSYLTKTDKKILDENGDSILYNIFKIIDLNYYVNTIYPHLFSHNEIEELEVILNKNVEEKTIFTDLIYKFIIEAESRVKNVYESREKYEEIVTKKIRINNIQINKEVNDDNNIFEKINEWVNLLSIGEYVINNYWEEYKTWKLFRHREKSLLYFTNDFKYTLFYFHYLYCDGRMLFYIFSALNEPHALDIDHINYILEMAPKLRIASYLNEEYAKYKKLYNPDAREFDFGVDEPEEETTIEEQLLPESEQIEDEKKEKLHLGPLSRFTKDQLIKLLEKFRDRKEPFVHKETKNKNWLFVFGMNGDTPPKGFEKIKWEAKYNGQIAKGALIDFLELLGYDINQLYKVDSIKILNECFECYNRDNKLVPIAQNDFHYNKRTKEREHSKMFYNIFKEIIEGIEKQP